MPRNFPAVLIIFTGRVGAGNPPLRAGRPSLMLTNLNQILNISAQESYCYQAHCDGPSAQAEYSTPSKQSNPPEGYRQLLFSIHPHNNTNDSATSLSRAIQHKHNRGVHLDQPPTIIVVFQGSYYRTSFSNKCKYVLM